MQLASECGHRGTTILRPMKVAVHKCCRWCTGQRYSGGGPTRTCHLLGTAQAQLAASPPPPLLFLFSAAANMPCIAFCQVSTPSEGKSLNTLEMIDKMKQAALSGAKLAVFGERALNTGLTKDHKASSKEIAIAAQQFSIAVIYGFVEYNPLHMYNALMFIDHSGKEVGCYRKVHFSCIDQGTFEAGTKMCVVSLDNLRIGLAIGSDLLVPQFFTAMSSKAGAQLVIVASGVEDHALSSQYGTIVHARAVENQFHVALVELEAFKICQPSGQTLPLHSNTEGILLHDFQPGTFFKNRQQLLPKPQPELYTAAISYETEVPWENETSAATQEFFHNRAGYYDQQMRDVQYNAPMIVAKAVAQVGAQKNGRVLDIAAGTGLVGEAFAQHGFVNMVALDRNEAMLQEAEKKGIYKEIILGPFEVKATSLPSGSFHVCHCVGSLMTMQWLNPLVLLQEMLRLVEVAGFLVLLWNTTELKEPQCQEVAITLEKILDDLQMEEGCKVLQHKSVPNYLGACEGTLWIAQKLRPIKLC